MRRDQPIVEPGGEVVAAGLTLSPAARAMPWQAVQATIALDRAVSESAREELLESLAVHLVSETDQIGASGKVLRAPLLRDPFHATKTHLVTTIRFDLRDVVRAYVPDDDAYWVHLSAGALVAAPIRVVVASSSLDRVEARGTGDALAIAYARATAGEESAALTALRPLLSKEEVRGDLDRPHLYNAACLASRIAQQESNAKARAKLLDEATGWLDADFKLLSTAGEPLRAALAKAKDERSALRLRARRALLDAHLDARTSDPDLAAVRAQP